MRPDAQDPINRLRFPVDEWAIVETGFDAANQGTSETLFTVGNGYLGLRGNVEEGRAGHVHGTFINGFHETWPIRHAEEAFGFARIGQTIVNAPDAKIIRLYVDDEPLVVTEAEILDYTRRLDFRTGVLSRSVVWRTPAGKHVRVTSHRMTSFVDRHLAVLDYEVELLDADAAVTITSQILNRQDGGDEYRGHAADESALDPRKAEAFHERVLHPQVKRRSDGCYALGYRTESSGMTIVVAARHTITTENPWTETGSIDDDRAEHVYRVSATAGRTIRVVKLISYHTATSVPAGELVERADRTLDRAETVGAEGLFHAQRSWLEDFWTRSDVEIGGQPMLTQAVRWNIFQLAQATARTDGGGVAAKGVTGSGYSGHYFWDTEIYVMPFLTYTAPVVARNVLRFRQRMLPAARARAAEMNQRGALFPWRTINGLEASAYYAAGTAQYHIDADISYALMQYVRASGDEGFLLGGAVDILVETARLWEDLGFWRSNREESFHIHGVTGPDEYTTVVNDNLYTNVMARANLEDAARVVDKMATTDPLEYSKLAARVGLGPEEVAGWRRAAAHMHIPFDDKVGVHPQDEAFLAKEMWDLENMPEGRRPLLLHYHPLVIYRFQVLKQADVVLALFLQGDRFTAEQKRADFDYYDPLTTGDSTLSAVVQSIMAAEVGYHDLALDYFRSALFVDLADLHRNAADGVHVASTGGVWNALVSGFGGFRDHRGVFSFDPRLPDDWSELVFRLALGDARLRVSVGSSVIRFELETGERVELEVRGEPVVVVAGMEARVALEGQGPRLVTTPTMGDVEGTNRSDGTVFTSSIPTPLPEEDAAGAYDRVGSGGASAEA